MRLGQGRITTNNGDLFAIVEQANLALDPKPALHAAPRVVCWTGWFGEAPGDGSFPRDMRTWMPAGRAALDRSCAVWTEAFRARGIELCLRPHARHILSDVQGTLHLLRERSDFRILVDPASLLTGAMLGRAEEHLARIFEHLGTHPAAAGVLLANVERCAGDDEDALRACPLGRGVLDRGMILRLWREFCPPTLPCILLEGDGTRLGPVSPV